ncbi:envelope-like protein, partial [Trifolium pratense]
NVDESAEKDSNVIYVDNLNLTERTPASSTRRLRSNAGKGVDVSNVPVKTAKENKIYSLKRQWSKITGPSEPKKKLLWRKTISSSDSEFEEDQHATASPAASSKKSVKKKRIPQDVFPVPIDNISFHCVENVDTWKCVVKRRLAVERNSVKNSHNAKSLLILLMK